MKPYSECDETPMVITCKRCGELFAEDDCPYCEPEPLARRPMMFVLPSVHLPTEAIVTWGEPHFLDSEYDSAKTWVVKLEVRHPGFSCFELTFFGTKKQVKQIAGWDHEINP